ncbi:helix-turn-helix transcriptional regulator [Paenibacillus daejeonensis]|uniref:helix-turn-helix transcriptional regulator n=1 Tax=Paenibacillus daejeonensis TaxID=135193 RepID=UPI0003801539|nr:helix-turn-helix domain-containing protein [Paenibacillus daejeonensis]
MKRNELIAARKSKGLTQLELAQRIGITRAYLANIERGEHDPSLKVAQAIARELKKNISVIFRPESA